MDHARAIVDALGTGHRVRWFRVLDRDEPAIDAPADVEVIELRTTVPSFRVVFDRVFDLESENRFAALCRDDPPDLVHCLAFGPAVSVHLPWLAGRLGVPCVVSVDVVESLCHRGTFIDETGAKCLAIDDAERCTACCLTAAGDGLGAWSARLGRMLRWMGDASPFPNRTAVRNRLDTLIGGLAAERHVLVADQQARQMLVDVGVPARSLRVLPPSDIATVLELYEAAIEPA